MRARSSILAGGALLVLSLLAAGCAIPAPGGARRETAHYEIRTDASDEKLSRVAAATAEQVHRALESQFGVPLGGAFPLVVYSSRMLFEANVSPALRGRGFVGECGSRCALVYWPDELRGQDTLAHEIVHHFVNELAPGLPYWMDEGLAKALAPKRTQSPADWLAVVDDLRERDLDRAIASLESLPDGTEYALRCLVAAAVVRFALETGNLTDLRGLERWQLDRDRFKAWLRGRHWTPFRRFLPVVEPEK